MPATILVSGRASSSTSSGTPLVNAVPVGIVGKNSAGVDSIDSQQIAARKDVVTEIDVRDPVAKQV